MRKTEFTRSCVREIRFVERKAILLVLKQIDSVLELHDVSAILR